MPFKKYLSRESVFLDKDLTDWEKTLDFLADHFAGLTGLETADIHELLMQREKIGSTWIGGDTVLPHNHSPKVEGIHIVFIRTKNPLLLPDGNRVRYVFSLLTSGHEGNTYLAILQGIGKLMKEDADKLAACSTVDELFSLIDESSHLTGMPLKASDLAMEWPVLKEDDTIGRALDLMKKHKVQFLPIVSWKTGKLCGVLDLVDLLKASFPDYVFSLSDLSLVQDFKPVKFFWSREDELNASEYMRDYRPYIVRSDASYPEIFFLMIKGNRRHLLVMDAQDNLKGVIRPEQIIDKMLRP
ncbi:MAG: PTS sugar transporter subunit IIA [Spirochaetales bacterium]|nr:PTS sugar transporter subunit IIA [Spirochaetales bacterium]